MLNKLIKNKLLGNAHAFIIKMCPGENTIYSNRRILNLEVGSLLCARILHICFLFRFVFWKTTGAYQTYIYFSKLKIFVQLTFNFISVFSENETSRLHLLYSQASSGIKLNTVRPLTNDNFVKLLSVVDEVLCAG